jgi:hypothetical protein
MINEQLLFEVVKTEAFLIWLVSPLQCGRSSLDSKHMKKWAIVDAMESICFKLLIAQHCSFYVKNV